MRKITSILAAAMIAMSMTAATGVSASAETLDTPVEEIDMKMKKFALIIISIVLSVILLNVPMKAVYLSDIPTMNEQSFQGIQVLEKNIRLKTHLDVKDDILVIPTGKRIIIDSGSLNIYSGVFVEQGGSIIIKKGNLHIFEQGKLFSEGTISVGSKGSLYMESNSILFCGIESVLKINGTSKLSEVSSSFCLGEYIGEEYSIATNLLAAVKYNYISFDSLKTTGYSYCFTDEAKKMLPDLEIDTDQDGRGGSIPTIIIFFFDNGQTVNCQVCNGYYAIEGIYFKNSTNITLYDG
jgi:hypothetical protein